MTVGKIVFTATVSADKKPEAILIQNNTAFPISKEFNEHLHAEGTAALEELALYGNVGELLKFSIEFTQEDSEGN